MLWLCCPSYVRDVVVPAVRAGRERAEDLHRGLSPAMLRLAGEIGIANPRRSRRLELAHGLLAIALNRIGIAAGTHDLALSEVSLAARRSDTASTSAWRDVK